MWHWRTSDRQLCLLQVWVSWRDTLYPKDGRSSKTSSGNFIRQVHLSGSDLQISAQAPIFSFTRDIANSTTRDEILILQIFHMSELLFFLHVKHKKRKLNKPHSRILFFPAACWLSGLSWTMKLHCSHALNWMWPLSRVYCLNRNLGGTWRILWTCWEARTGRDPCWAWLLPHHNY